ncbi:MAG TPA: endolytic transglycosylase MltG [Micromonosporaceae bacterium]
MDLADWSPGEWDDGDDADRKGNKRGRGRRKRRRGRTVLALLMVLVLFGLLGAGAWYGVGRVRDFFAVKDYSGPGTGEVVVQVKKGEFASDIANTLYTKDVVKSAAAFVAAANENPAASKKIEPGWYKLRHHMRAKLALEALVARNADNTLANKVSTRVTIPEGKTAKQTFALLSKQTGIPVADFEKAAKDPTALGVQSWWFKRNDGKAVAKTVEGFLYPSTYDFDPGANAEQILSAMVDQFNTVVGEMKFAEFVQAHRGGISPYEALIVASLAQAEAGVPEDLGKVARVAYNRAYGGNWPCGCLQFDVTENYWLELQGKAMKPSKDLTISELNDPKNPYNTHSKPGLPVGPINSPGKAALQAAMDPPAGTWVYFVAIDKQGHSAFASTKAEFDKYYNQACAAKVIC